MKCSFPFYVLPKLGVGSSTAKRAHSWNQIEVSRHITPPTSRQFEIYKSITNALDIPLNLFSLSLNPALMESSRSRSFFQDIRWREVNGFRGSSLFHRFLYIYVLSPYIYISTYTPIDRFYTLFCLVTLFLSSFFRALKRGKVGVVLKLIALCGVQRKIIG